MTHAETICMFLLSLLCKGALLLGAAGLLGGLLRRRPAARHLLLGLAFGGALLLIPLSLLLPAWRPAGALTLTAEGSPGLLAGPVAAGAAGLWRALGQIPLSRSSAGASPEAGAETGTRTETDQAAAGSRAWLWLWGGGALLLLLRSAGGLLLARRLGRRAAPDRDGTRAGQILAALATPGRRVPLRWHRRPDLPPMTVGLWRPVVLLPEAARAWSDERLRLVLLHELAHARRRDCLTQALAQLGCALYWVLPLSWLAARRMRLLREAAADDLVLAAGVRASDYARHLLDIAATLPLRPAYGSAAALPLRDGLEERLRALLLPGHRPAILTRPQVLAGGALLLGLVLPLSALRAGPRAGAAAPPSEARDSGAAAAVVAQVKDEVRRFFAHGGRPLPAGHRIELTLRPEVQAIVEEELDAAAAAQRPRGVSALVLDPRSGEILALSGRAAGGVKAPLLSVQAAYDTGSTMKPLTVAAALSRGAIRPDQTFFCENGRYAVNGAMMHDAAPHGDLRVDQILAVSSNIGAAKIYQALGKAALGGWLGRLRFGQAPELPLLGIAAGSPVDDRRWTEVQAASIAAGEGLSASPLQLAAAFAVVAGDGRYRTPVLVRSVRGAAGEVLYQPPTAAERVVEPAIAAEVRRLLLEVVQGAAGTGRLAAIPGVQVAGKTGTASKQGPDGRYVPGRYYASFVGAVPADSPRLLVLVGVDEAQGSSGMGSVVAAPVFQRIAARALALP